MPSMAFFVTSWQLAFSYSLDTGEQRLIGCYLSSDIGFKVKKFENLKTLPIKISIDRFHSRDRWPQWGGETIRNI
jgi:hypothetical protein